MQGWKMRGWKMREKEKCGTNVRLMKTRQTSTSFRHESLYNVSVTYYGNMMVVKL